MFCPTFKLTCRPPEFAAISAAEPLAVKLSDWLSCLTYCLQYIETIDSIEIQIVGKLLIKAPTIPPQIAAIKV